LFQSKRARPILLVARAEDDKRRFLALAGFTRVYADRLLDALLQIARANARFIEHTEYGDKFEIRGTLLGPNGRALRVVTIWMSEKATGQTKFNTLYPDKS